MNAHLLCSPLISMFIFVTALVERLFEPKKIYFFILLSALGLLTDVLLSYRLKKGVFHQIINQIIRFLNNGISFLNQ